MKRQAYYCAVCGDRLYLRSRDNDPDPYHVTDTDLLHQACLILLEQVMDEEGLPRCERGAREALAILAAERHVIQGMSSCEKPCPTTT